MQEAGPPEEDTWRILVATDNHLGYMERDPIRRDDSFEAFEEVLATAERENVDFVLLGGDLFHDNNPSRYTLHRTMEMLKKYCFGERAGGHKFDIMSEQSVHFQRASYANMADENLRIKLPIFSIHGNHDDPGDASLAALDLLHISSMINYFGKTDVADEITIPPLMLKKGESVLALYGLGNVRDERLGRMWTSDRVHFSEPQMDFAPRGDEEEEGYTPHMASQSSGSTTGSKLGKANPKSPTRRRSGIRSSVKVKKQDVEEMDTSQGTMSQASSKLNGSVEGRNSGLLTMLVLHQNRVPHGAKNYIPEDRVSQFDFVVWGHEHESIVTHTTRMDLEAYISQPGSSVATSLSEGEMARKHCVLLQVHKNSYAVHPIPLRTVRPFRLEHVRLSTFNISPQLSELQMIDAISKNLAQTVERMLAEIEAETCLDGSNPTAIWTNAKLPLIRLKVDYTGYSVINSKRFGQDFVNRVANPGDILLFASKRTAFGQSQFSNFGASTSASEAAGGAGGSAKKASSSRSSNAMIVEMPGTSVSSLGEAEQLLELAPQHAKIEEFLEEQLTSNLGTKLGIFHSTGLIRALQSFAEKEGSLNLGDTLEKQLKEVQLHVLNQPTAVTDRTNLSQAVSDYHKQLATKEDVFKVPSTSLAQTPKRNTSNTLIASALSAPSSLNASTSSNTSIHVKAEALGEIDDYDMYEVDPNQPSPKSSAARLLSSSTTSTKVLGDSDEEFEIASPAASDKRKRPPSKKTPAPLAISGVDLTSTPPPAKTSKRSSSKKPAAALTADSTSSTSSTITTTTTTTTPVVKREARSSVSPAAAPSKPTSSAAAKRAAAAAAAAASSSSAKATSSSAHNAVIVLDDSDEEELPPQKRLKTESPGPGSDSINTYRSTSAASTTAAAGDDHELPLFSEMRFPSQLPSSSQHMDTTEGTTIETTHTQHTQHTPSRTTRAKRSSASSGAPAASQRLVSPGPAPMVTLEDDTGESQEPESDITQTPPSSGAPRRWGRK